ncbi:DEAD-box ATP-dependent RNA helicase 57 isoform X2 [Ziziphus jujuba]|uniref:RNA helicase n=1 Tax=Ziziphus jujuba TaxID=326968 RepID=A0A6P4AVJ3_ZIZJJ|nr:DEAD-box ATP-dependent RNA helicase 57 isoform X2 [Ziziphus jujuba]
MSEDTSFLFSGLHFDRKKFAKDFSRFKEKENSDDLIENLSLVEVEKEEEKKVSTKKRKRNAAVSETVEGFTVFKNSKSASVENEQAKKESSQEKKKLNRQLEQDAIFRKKYNIHVSGNNVPCPLQNFTELSSRYGCRSKLLRNLAELGFKEPTPIQRQAIPVLLSGRDCFACAPTGSGKTLAFVCPMLMKLKHPSRDGIRAVILCPTRELACQSIRECKKMAKGYKFRIKLMTKELVRQNDLSNFFCDVLISTPLRLRLAVRKKKMDLSRVEYLVLDESDKLFELESLMIKQIDSIVKACTNPSIILSLFSATLPDYVEEIARTKMHDAVRVIIGRKNTATETVKQKLIFTGSEEGKLIALRQSFAESLNPPVLIFLQSKERAKELYAELSVANIRVDVIHSDLSQMQRENAVDDFRAGKTWVLIATDVIARGMDFKGVNCVINYDFPDSAAAYIHRIGRSGRAGRRGEAITFYTEQDIPFLRNIANAMAASGCEVPSWALTLPKLRWKEHRPRRDSISTNQENYGETSQR